MSSVHVCVLHPTMGAAIAREVRAAVPDANISVEHRVDRDPPGTAAFDVLVANTFPDGFLGRCPRLRWLHLTGAGSDHLPAGDPPAGLLVTNSPDVAAIAVAEYVWMALLALSKDAPGLVRNHLAHGWEPPDSRLVAGTRLLVVGLGHIGTEVARRAAAFGVEVVAVARRPRPSPMAERVVGPERLREVAAGADHLVAALPATAETAGLVGAEVIRAMPRHAVLLNVGRAWTVETSAVVTALRYGRLRAAVLDVHDVEPLPPTSPLWDVPNLWLTPHGAFRFPGEEEQVARLVRDNLLAFQAGRPLHNEVWPIGAGTADGRSR